MRREEPITSLKGIGEKTAASFHKLHIDTVGQLAGLFPRDYETMEEPVAIADLKPARVQAVKAAVIGTPVTKKFRNLTVTSVKVGDTTGMMNLTFFRMPYLKNTLKPGTFHIFRGLCQEKGDRYMEQPKIYKEEDYSKMVSIMQPKYPLTMGLSNAAVAKAVRQALEALDFSEFLPEDIRRIYHLCSFEEAMWQIHFPESEEQMTMARRRLVFDEFLFFIIGIRRMKEETEKLEVEEPLQKGFEAAKLLSALPYELTGAQKRVWREIEEDLCKKEAMNRLIQGDVGSGKTILAFLALLMTAENGRQGCLMAPTEVLAKQHYDALCEMSEKYGLCIKPELLTGSMTAKEKKMAYQRIAAGEVNAIVGTHALIQEKAAYRNLALVITDEQHRFGVRQRETLAGKGDQVHVLVMSATPIPRTLAIVLYGDLHVSVLDEMPANRLPIKNCVVDTSYRDKAYSFIQREIREGRQVYVICPMVEEGEMEGVENVLDYTEKLRMIMPPSIRISALHGKMKPAEKQEIMDELAAGNLDILVSTTVIEVGINVPNATVMMVENAERFGLAQLHQLRGRVGRGSYQSYCIFMSGNDSKKTMERLGILNKSNDGFFIANEDLRLRGPGDLFGVRQSGMLEFALGDIYQDADILLLTSEAADRIEEESSSQNPGRWEKFYRRMEEEGGSTIDFRTI